MEYVGTYLRSLKFENRRRSKFLYFLDFEFTFKKTSMYNPIVEAGSTHLAYSNIAQHWLNNGAPTSLPDGAIWANQLPISSPEFKAWSESSMEDWNTFLEQRSYEMMPGGYLVVNIQSSCLDSTMSENAAATLQKGQLNLLLSFFR